MSAALKRISRSLPLAALLGAALGTPGPALANDVYVLDIRPRTAMSVEITTAQDRTTTSVDAVKAAVDAAANKISDNMRRQSGQQVVTGRSQIQAASQMNDVMDARETQRRITDTRIRGIIGAAPGASVCNVITGSVYARSSFNAVGKWRAEISDQQLDNFMGATSATSARQGAAAALEQRIARHCAVGATAYDKDIGLCSEVVDQSHRVTTGDILKPSVGRDLNADTIMNTPNLTLSVAEKELGNTFLLHAFGGHLPGALPNGVAATEAGRRSAVDNMTAASQHSVAQNVGAAILADRNALPGTGGTGGASTDPNTRAGNTVTNASGSTRESVSSTISSWADSTAKQTIGYDQAGNNFPNGVSRSAYMKLRAMSWFWNANWAASVGSLGTSQNIKDIALILAFQVVQNSENYDQLERLNLSIATMLAIMEERQRPRSAN